MRIGIPKEVKPMEGRVSLVPPAAGELVMAGHQLFVETGAGVASGYPDDEYKAAGVNISADAAATYEAAELVVKVKEPVESEYGFLREDHTLFSYLHLAANAGLTAKLVSKGLTAVAFETIEVDGRLPLLAPMSDIAGQLATQIGTTLLHSPHGGRGVLLGGLPAAERGNVVILGAGVAGGNAARVAANLGANVTVFGLHRDSLASMRDLGANVTALPSYDKLRRQAVAEADLLIGAVLIPGAKAPHLVSEDMVRTMKPGSVIIDISVDQGGCIETIRPTDYTAPTYVYEQVIHFGVTNMPGAVPRSASQALSAELAAYVLRLSADGGINNPLFKEGINIKAGEIVHPAVALAVG